VASPPLRCCRALAITGDMHPRKPLPHADQLSRLRRYLRRTRTELRHRYEECFDATRGRRECPLEVRVRRRMIEHYDETASLLEACVKEMERQEAMFYAPFKPGDRIEVLQIRDGICEAAGPYLVVDVLPDKRARYMYDCVALTKAGAIYKRGGARWIRPDTVENIRSSDAQLNKDGQWEAENFRRCADTSRLLAYELGDITLFEGQLDSFGRPRHRRKDRLDP